MFEIIQKCFQSSRLVPPKNITIVSEEGNVVSNSVIGPYKEGSSVNVTCMSTGGKYFYATNEVANDMMKKSRDEHPRNIF